MSDPIQNVVPVAKHRIHQIMGKAMYGLETHSIFDLMIAAYIWGLRDGLQVCVDNPNCVKEKLSWLLEKFPLYGKDN